MGAKPLRLTPVTVAVPDRVISSSRALLTANQAAALILSAA